MSVTLRELQTNLPWGIRYSRDFRANPQSHKDFAHALLHVLKAAGKLAIVVDSIDHDHEVAHDPSLREQNGKFIADLVYCALRMANTFPGGAVDLEAALLRRIEEKHVRLDAPPPFLNDDEPWNGLPVVVPIAAPDRPMVGPARSDEKRFSIEAPDGTDWPLGED